MKISLDFPTLKGICYSIVERLERKYEPFDEVIAITRGGLVPAAIIAKKLKLDCGIYSPKSRRLSLVNPDSKRLLVIEDLVAYGRTYKQVMEDLRDFDWSFVPILVDAAYPGDFPVYGLRTGAWIEFPWEESEKVKEGDRGLFRDRTDQYQ